jgi:hypothetical protein
VSSQQTDQQRQDICTPRIEGGKVLWDLPDVLAADVPAKTTA